METLKYIFIYGVISVLILIPVEDIASDTSYKSEVDMHVFDKWWIYEDSHQINHLYEDQMELFLDAIGFRESSNNYKAINSYGYFGRYQFSIGLARRLGYTQTLDYFLKNPSVQDSMMLSLLTHNKSILNSYIERYHGTIRHGRIITKSGILAAAHLIGPHRTKIYLDYNIDYSDANGTYTSMYLFEFSGYDINI